MFWNKFCGVITIFFLCGVNSSAQLTYYSKTERNIFSKKYIYKPLTAGKIVNSKEIRKEELPVKIISPDYYTQHFGIMCHQELAIEKAIKIPFRFRLGSLQQCNYLEGKK